MPKGNGDSIYLNVERTRLAVGLEPLSVPVRHGTCAPIIQLLDENSVSPLTATLAIISQMREFMQLADQIKHADLRTHR